MDDAERAELARDRAETDAQLVELIGVNPFGLAPDAQAVAERLQSGTITVEEGALAMWVVGLFDSVRQNYMDGKIDDADAFEAFLAAIESYASFLETLDETGDPMDKDKESRDARITQLVERRVARQEESK